MDSVGRILVPKQLRDALGRGQDDGHVGPHLNALVQQALRTGKRVHSETGIDEVSRSLVTAGLDAAEEHVGDLAEAHVLVVGAGAMGSGIAQVAAQAGHEVVLVDARPLFARGGGIHCITQQQPG